MTDAVARPQPIQRYNTTAMALHWLVAALILINIVAGLTAVSRGKDPSAQTVIDVHKSIGLTILGLVVLRILWRLAKTPPPMPRTYAPWETWTAHAVHYLLYALMLLLPLSGYIHDSAWKEAPAHPILLYGLVHFPRLAYVKTLDPATKEAVHSGFAAVHLYLSYVLYALLALHLLGVAKHHAVDREEELQRMLPGGYRRPEVT